MLSEAAVEMRAMPRLTQSPTVSATKVSSFYHLFLFIKKLTVLNINHYDYETSIFTLCTKVSVNYYHRSYSPLYLVVAFF